MKQKIITLILINLIALNISAQKVKSSKENLEKANIAFNNEDFEKAIPLYLDVLDKKEIAEALINVAECYRKLGNWGEAEYWYAQIVALPEAKPIYFLYYGKVLQANGKCDLAIEFFNEYSRQEPDDFRGVLLATACQKQELCPPKGADYCKNYEILPLKINTIFNDYSPTIHQNKLVYTSDYHTTNWTIDCLIGCRTSNLYSRQIDTLDEINKEYVYGNRTSIVLKEKSKLNASAIFTTDGNKMLFNEAEITDAAPNLRLRLSIAVKTNAGWEIVERFRFNSKEYSIAHPALSSGNDTLYFSSDMPGGFGGMDLYFSVIKDGNWSEPINLGGEINTEGHEISPFYHKTGKLYFSSNGQADSRNFDIFYVNLNHKPSIVTRLPAPLNSKYNEHGFILNEDGTFGYFSSNRMGGLGGDDIYGVKIKVELDKKD